MAGYTRQSVADIIASAIIKAGPINAEYNALRDAFAFSGGHKHDGSSTEGAYVPLIADTDAKNKVVVDTSNNRISVFTEVSGAAVEQLRIIDGAIVPVTDNDIDLGSDVLEFKNLYIDGTAFIDTLQVDQSATITADLTVNGNTTLGNSASDTVTLTADVASHITPSVDSTYDLGAAGSEWRDLYIDGTANIDSLVADTADINGGTLDGVTIGGTTAAAGTFTTLTATGTTTITTADINGGAIDNTIIGASSTAAGSFTTVTTSGQATLASADINGGTIDGSVIGGASAQAITGTTITANTGFTGDLTGDVTGNLTGNVTGDITGDVTGDLTGNVTSSGTSSFNNVTIDGTLNMNAGTTATITNLTTPVNSGDAATKGYVDTAVSDLVDSAPAALDTLNELAAALGDDADFSTTVTNSIATKLPLAGGTMTGAIAMGTSKITGLGDPTSAQDATTKTYVDTVDATKLNLSGGTMTGNIVMGSNKVTSTATPTADSDLTRKAYVDSILGSATSAADSAAAAATSESNAATSETNAANSASAAAASYDSFDDRYLGAKSSAPSVDNDGDALLTGALYFNSTNDQMYVWDGSTWLSTQYDSSNVDINGGTIDGTVIGGSTPAAGSFTNITATGTVDGRDVAADGTKLDGIEASADVTDTANVTAAGALMDSELTDIAAVKALDQGVATTDDPTFTNTQLAEIAATISDTAVDVFVYDTSKDSDGGAWRKRTQGTSWYNETLNTATRGSRREFPAVAVIVADNSTSPRQVTIYDGDDPDLPMWMVFKANGGVTVGTDRMYLSGSVNFTGVSMLNGKLAVTSTYSNPRSGIDLIDFLSDSGVHITNAATNTVQQSQPIAQRNTLSVVLSYSHPVIVNDRVNDVAMTVLPNAPIDAATGLPVPTIACLVAETKVQMADGSTKRLDQVEVGDVVKTLEGHHSVLNWWDQGVKDVVELTFDGGQQITCTSDHKIRTTDGWVEAGDLTDAHEVVGL